VSRRFVESEGRRWIDMGIITPEQHRQILLLYSEQKRAFGLVPLLGGILVGLGIISFVAANWQGIPQLLRLLLLIAAMAGFYGAGEILFKRGQDKTGIAFLGLGLLSFGAGIVLTAQMFHLEAYSAASWVVWGAAGLFLTYLYDSRFLYAISTLLFAVAQGYSVIQFHHFSSAAFLIGLAGLGYYAWRRQNSLPVWLFSLIFLEQTVLFVIAHREKPVWAAIPAALLYTLGDGLQNRRAFYPLQTVALLAAFAFDWLLAMFAGKGQLLEIKREWLPAAAPFLSIFAILLLVSLFLKLRTGRAATAAEWLLMPVFLYAAGAADALYMIVLFVFSLYLLWRGYTEEWRSKINLGTWLFLLSTMTAYGKLAWDFMDKSLFFIVGGALLLALGWLLNRRKKQFFLDRKEETNRVP
jgi:uncharacterized membrane protein